MNYRKIVNLSVLLLLFLSFIGVNAEGVKNKRGESLSKTNGEPSRTNFNINNISTWINNNGDSDLNPSNDSGFEFPKGSNRTVFYESGFVWGATVGGERRVGGNTYNQGILPGAVINGVREDTEAEHVRIYRVRRDWETGDVSAEMRDEENTEDAVRAQYQKDWNEWPASYGAPYEDVDGNGTYDPSLDIPGFPGSDQTVWFVANDLDPTTTRSLYGSEPMGVEIQATFWGYSSQGALGNVMFRKYKMINVSDDVFDTMFVSMWSDPDLGGAGDDYAGADVDLSLMFIYNGDGDDSQYGSVIPAGGFDFFQGPIVAGEAGDVAIFDNKERPGFKNLPMSAHYFFINSDDVYSDPDLGNYVDGTLQFHNLFRGRISATGVPFVDPTTGEQTKFTLSGDVATQQGWVDGLLHGPGDRRQGMVSGPFTMAPGDTQEVVVAQMAAGAFGTVDRISAVALLKFIDQEAQSAYDNFFQIPPSPPAPEYTISELNNEISISWNGSNVGLIESFDTLGYSFQGYVVYQFPTKFASIQDAKLVATYDLNDGVGKVIGDGFNSDQGVVLPEVKKFGSDSGIKRSISIDQDLFNSNAPLNNGSEYYFAVSAYAVNSNLTVVPNVLESNILTVTMVPKAEGPGYTLNETGNVSEATHVGPSDGFLNVEVVNPGLVTGHDYKVNFSVVDSMVVWNNLSRGYDTLFGSSVWKLTDVTTGEVKLDNQLNQSADDTSPIVDGLIWRVSGAPNDFKSFQVVSNANGPIDPPEAAAPEWQGFPVPLDDEGHNLRPTDNQQVGSGEWMFHTGDPGQTRGAYSGGDQTFIGRSLRNDNFDRLIPFDWEMRFTARGSWALRWFEDDFLVKVPFELWNVGVATYDDPSDDYRVIPYFLSTTGGGGAAATDPDELTWQLDPVDHGGSGGSDDPQTPWIYWIIPHAHDDNSPGTAGYDEYLTQIDTTIVGAVGNVSFAGGTEVIARSVLFSWNGDDVSDGVVEPGTQMVPEEGTVFRLISTKPNSASDEFLYTAPSNDFDAAAAKEDVKEINVFPNPYYGTHDGEINKYQRFVTFNHLPPSATIKVFNLAGQLVRTIVKDDASQFQKWDLVNETGLPVASGLYIVHIDMPDLGETKILKVAVIQETQILDRF